MVPVIRVIAVIVVLSGLIPIVQAGELPSRPQRAVIYRDGYAVLEEQLGPKARSGAILLPVGTELTSVQVLLDGRRLGNLEIEKLQEDEQSTEKTLVHGRVVAERTTTIKRHTGYLLRLGKVSRGKLTLRYGTSGISWQPQIHTEVLDAKRVSVTLTGLVTNSALDLSRCRIRLASAAGPLSSKIYFNAALQSSYQTPGQVLTRSADQIYDAGLQTVLKDRSAVLTLLSGTGSYDRKLIWHTDSRERVQVVLMVNNPFRVPICPAPVNLYRGGIMISRDSAEWAPPGTPIILAAGHAPEIQIERSVDTTENLANKARPFRHSINFQATNQGDQPVRLEVVMQKKIGSRHKTLYHFKRKPDRRPGTLFIWELDLNKGQTTKIAFKFDSEHARFAGYQTYEKARYAMH